MSVWGPAISIASLVLANVVALLLNPGLFRSRCGGRRARARPSDNDGSVAPSPAPTSPTPTPVPTPRRCRCAPLPFFASNVSARAAAKQAGAAAGGDGERPHAPLPRELWGFDVLSPRHALSSWLAPASSVSSDDGGDDGGGWRPALWVLLPLHALTFAYFVMYVLLEILWKIPLPGPPDNPYPEWLSYLTNWSISLLGLSGLLGGANTLRSWARQRRRRQPQAPAAAERWDALSIAHQLVAEIAVSAAFFVTIFYWGGVVGLGGSGGGGGGDLGVDATSFVAHAGNSGLAALQLLLTRLPVASAHFLALLWYASAYMVFAWAFGSATGDWRYGLDWRRAGPAVAYVLVPPCCFFVFFFVAFGLASTREGAGRRGWCWCGRERRAKAAAPSGEAPGGGAV